MTTKEQERKALEQIRKIVAGLGEDSYVATAFEGCFEDAEQNIEFDWACSYKDRFQNAMNKACEWENEAKENAEDAQEWHSRYDKVKAELELAKATLKQECERADRLADELSLARWEVTIETENDRICIPNAKITYRNNNGFKLVNVEEESGWITSYKLDELKRFEVR